MAPKMGVVTSLICFLLGTPSPALSALALPSPPTGERARVRGTQDRENPLATAKGLRCVFPVHATGTWTNGEPSAEVKTAEFSLRFASIDTQEGTAEAVRSRAGVSHIIARLAGDTLHLLQINSTGSMYTTTVFNIENRTGTLKAVHSRHAFTEVVQLDVTSRPVQYYGECTVEE